MNTFTTRCRASAGWTALVLAIAAPLSQAQSVGSVYYICPGNVFTNTLSAKEAETRGCKAREAQQPTTVAAPKARSTEKTSAPASHSGEGRVDADEQRSRDSDARRILEAELQREEAALEALKRDYNGGEPERRGDERNAQRYLDRIAEMKAAIVRKEADIAAIKRELGKLRS
jgi:hypothetical protein